MALSTLTQSAFSIVPQIGSVFGLIAFIAAIILYILRSRSRNELETIKSAKDDHRAGLIKDLADKYSIPTNKISSDQQYDLLQRKLELDYRKRNQVFIFLGFLTIVLSVIIIMLIVNENEASPGQVTPKISRQENSSVHSPDSVPVLPKKETNQPNIEQTTTPSQKTISSPKKPVPNNYRTPLSASFTNISMGSTLETTRPLLQGIVQGTIPKGYNAYAVIMFGNSANFLSKLTLKSNGQFTTKAFLGMDGQVTIGIIVCDAVTSTNIARNLNNGNYSIPISEGDVKLLESVTVFVNEDPELHGDLQPE
jgi:hypothetical protein